jgi:hypothetical protein
MQGCPVGFEEVAPAAEAVPLPPGAPARMTVGAEMAEPHPPAILAVGIGTAVGGGVDVAPTSTRGGER